MLALALRFLDINVNFDLDKAIKTVTDALGKYGPLAYGAAKQRVLVGAYINLFWAGLGVIFFVLAIWLTVWGIRSAIAKHSDDYHWGTAAGVTGIVFFGLFAAVNLNDGLTVLFAPDWAAIQLILNR